jgi:capsular polysaccharide biosynthesis protein/Mrp family chromosome partitioning ATPase
MRSSSVTELTSPAQDLGAALRAVKRRASVAMAICALTVAATLGVTRLGPSRYEATAQILLQQPDQVNAVLNPDAITSAANVQREVNTNAQLITSVPVADAVRRQLHLTESVRDLVGRLSVTGEATSNLVEITARDERPERAARVATAVAVKYQSYRRRSAQEAIGPAISAAALRLRGMDATTRGSAEGKELESRLHQLETGAAVATGGVQVVRPAAIPLRPEPRVPPLTAAVAVMLGLALAALAVTLLERFDRRLLDEEDVEAAFGHAVTGRIPAPGRRGSHNGRRTEAFDALAARLRSTAPSPHGRVVMLAAAAPYAGDDVAIRLAEALADLEPRVMLIDADLRHESSGEGAELAESGGLTAILCDQSTLEDEIVLASYGQDGDDPLPARAWELLPAGCGASRPTALLGSPEMEALLALARNRADIVIVAAPSLASGADALVLAPLCDEIVVVVRERSATRDQARGARQVLAATSTPVVGLIFEHGAPARWSPAPPRRRLKAILQRRSGSRDEPSRPSTARA